MAQAWETAVFGGGCFWCLDAIFQQVQGVVDVRPGFAGGTVENPSYEQVCTGNTGHAEVVRVQYDSSKVSYEALVRLFFHVHDPTTLNRQGADRGTQYRSVIFFQSEVQKADALRVQAEVAAAKLWPDPIVTELVPLQAFYQAEAYHWDYFNQNSGQAYCRLVISPKLAKFRKEFPNLLKRQ